MTIAQAKNVLKQNYPSNTINTNQLMMLHKQFHKKNKMPASLKKIKQAVKVLYKKPIGYRIADIGAKGKEYNVKTSKHWKENISKNPLPPGLVKVGKFGSKILARRAGAAGLSFGAGPVAGAAMTTAGVLLTGKDLYNYIKANRKKTPKKRKKK